MIPSLTDSQFVLLSVDSSTDVLSLALTISGELGPHAVMPTKRKLASLFPTCIATFLKSHGLTYESLHGICLNVGPGSFTGVRMGIAASLGIAMPLGIPIWGVTGFQSAYLSQQRVSDSPLGPCAVIVRDEVGKSYYRQTLGSLLSPCAPYQEVSHLSEEMLLSDEIFWKTDQGFILPESFSNPILPAPIQTSYPLKYHEATSTQAAAIGQAGWFLYKNQLIVPPMPLYGKPCYANSVLKKEL